jgi:prepilin-type processing-associated H-X9-DG protein
MKSGIIFTKKDVIFILGSIVFLLMNLAAVENRGRERAKRLVCLSNIKQLTAAYNVYADENDGILPGTAGAWLQDVEIKTIHFMLETGITRKMFYCPSNTSHQKYNDLFWLYNNRSWNGEKFTNETGFVVSGYCHILELSYWPSGLRRPDIVAYEKDTEKKIWLRTNKESSPVTRELCVDTIMGIQQSNTKYGRNFDQIPGGLYAQNAVYDRTNHLMSDGDPPGGNIGFLDGHGEWRLFDPDIKNGVAVPRYGNTPGFFW